MLRTGNGPQAQVPAGVPVTMLLSNRFWEDTTFGTLSSDGESVFSIEDLQLSYPNMIALPMPELLRDYNRLVAHDVKTGRAIWEAGGSRSNVADPLAGTFF